MDEGLLPSGLTALHRQNSFGYLAASCVATTQQLKSDTIGNQTGGKREILLAK